MPVSPKQGIFSNGMAGQVIRTGIVIGAVSLAMGLVAAGVVVAMLGRNGGAKP